MLERFLSFSSLSLCLPCLSSSCPPCRSVCYMLSSHTELYTQIYLSQTPLAHMGTHRETPRHMRFLCFCLQSGSRRSTGLGTRRLAALSALLPVNSRMPPPYSEKMCPWPRRFQATLCALIQLLVLALPTSPHSFLP